MPKAKNLGPCIISDCKNTAVKFNKMTSYTIEKIRDKNSERQYDFIKEGDQLCYTHYMEIVEPDRHDKKKKRKSSESLNNENVQVMTDKLYGEPSSSKSTDELDWSKIKLNFDEENVIVSKEDFSLLVDNINQIKLQLDNITCHTDVHEDSSVHITDKDVND
ncbi:13040_t:CDS:1, partial [Entrophospora sp. SA101]